MATPTTTVPDYCGGLTKSRLLPGERVSLLYDAWRTRAAGRDDDVDGFRRYLVDGRHLTDYQAALLQRGHTEGFLLGGYVILDRISRGSGAKVYKAVHAGSGQVVALKLLPQSKAAHPAILARFQRDARQHAQLEHPNIVRAFQVGQTGGLHYLALEHLEGETLDDVFARRFKLTPPEAVRIAVQVLNALQHLHEKHLVHRDVKPSNILLAPAGGESTLAATAKLQHIGLGRDFFDDVAVNGDASGSHSSPDYLAPERARDARTADIRADIYSLGCVLYQMLAGRPPFVETNPMAAMVRHATEPPPSIGPFSPDAPPGLAAVLEVLLAKRASDRFGVPRDAAQALEPFLPRDNHPSASTRIVPAYLQWLAAESRNGAASIGGPMSSARLGPGVRLSGPVSATRLSGPVSSARLGRGLAAAEPAPAAAAPSTLKPPSAPPRPAPNLIAPTDTTPPSEADVELMPLEELQARIVYNRPDRALWDLDRRDFIMLGLGSGGVIAAVAIGIFAAKFNEDKIRRGPEEDE